MKSLQKVHNYKENLFFCQSCTILIDKKNITSVSLANLRGWELCFLLTNQVLAKVCNVFLFDQNYATLTVKHISLDKNIHNCPKEHHQGHSEDLGIPVVKNIKFWGDDVISVPIHDAPAFLLNFENIQFFHYFIKFSFFIEGHKIWTNLPLDLTFS